MKHLIFSLILLLGLSEAKADFSKRGYIITPKASVQQNSLYEEGSSATLEGDICLAKVSAVKDDIKCEKVKNNHAEIKAFFPDETNEVTSSVQFDKKSKSLSYRYLTPSLSSSDENTFTLVVGAIGSRGMNLVKIRAKLQKRIDLLERRLSHPDGHHSQKYLEKRREIIEALIAVLSNALVKVEKAIDEDPTILAKLKMPVGVKNGLPQAMSYNSIFNDVRLGFTLNPGIVAQGEKININSRITNLSGKSILYPDFDDDNDHIFDFRNDQFAIKYKFNGAVVKEYSKIGIPLGESLEDSYVSAPLSTGNSNNFEIELYHVKKFFLTFKIKSGEVSQRAAVIPDTVKPKWEENTFSPAIAVQSGKTFPLISGIVKDELGKIDPASIKLKVDGVDKSNLLILVSIDSGRAYHVSANINPVVDGSHTIEVFARDYAGNAALPYPLSRTVYVDGTAPILSAFIPKPDVILYGSSSNIALSGESNEPLTAITVNGSSLGLDITGTKFSGTISRLASTDEYLQYVATDLYGNQTSKNVRLNFVLDQIAPVITANILDGMVFNSMSQTLNLNIADNSPISYNVLLNNQMISSGFTSSTSIPLVLVEGNNTLLVQAVDAAGNNAIPYQANIVLDTIAPILSNLIPASGEDVTVASGSINVSGLANEKLSEISINDYPLLLSADGKSFSGIYFVTGSGPTVLTFKAKDVAGNESLASHSVNLINDLIAPLVTLSGQMNVFLNSSTYSFSVDVTEENSVVVTISQNGSVLYTSSSKSFAVNATLVEGLNYFDVVAVDSAGNTSAMQRLENIALDTNPPQIQVSTPSNGSVVNDTQFLISGTSNEPLQSLTAFGNLLSLSSGGTAFSGNVAAPMEGSVSVPIIAKDLAGNESQLSISITVNPSLLNIALVTVEPAPTGSFLNVKGAPYAARPGAVVELKTGLFSVQSAVAASDGSFLFSSEVFNSATLTVRDNATGTSQSGTLNFNVDTQLAGVVRDISGTPLPGATVWLDGTTNKVTTNASGAFVLNNIVTGDQRLIIDGSTISPSVVGVGKSYAKVKVGVNIGVSQNNVLQRPIYLSPLMLDGSETNVTNGAATTVISSHAPGVEISIPSGVVIFPDGTNSGSINMMRVSSSVSTVPTLSFAKPENIISLEPSGLRFSEPVQLTLPNDYGLPSDVEVLILSLNSEKGIWEVDGAGIVSGNSITTKPGQGITHFSSVYAVPLAPYVQKVGSLGRSGVETFEGGVSAEINMPSFQSLGSSIAPGLIYNSAWAKPTAVVTNYFDIPQQRVNLELQSLGGRDIYWTVKVCYQIFGRGCVDHVYENYWQHIRWQSNAQITNWYEPDSIDAQFFVGTIKSEKLELDTSFFDTSGNINTNTKVVSTMPVNWTDLPNQAVMSFGVELADPISGEYLSTGIYPSLTKFKVHLNQLTLTTTSTKVWSNLSGPQYSNDSKLESTLLEQAFPQDVIDPIYVQNEARSPAGRGWKIAGVQKIANPEASRIAIDEGNGKVSLYNIGNSIDTLFDAENTNVDLRMGANLKNWPNADVTAFDGTSITSISQLDLSQPDPQVSVGVSVPQNQGTINSSVPGQCQFGTKQVFREYPFKQKRVLESILRLPNGKMIATDANGHAVFELESGTYRQILNLTSVPAQVFSSQAELELYCQNTLQIPCTTFTTKEFNCSQVILNPNSGTLGGPGSAFFHSNNPMGLALSPDGSRIIVADSGNNRIKSLPIGGTPFGATVIAGNGQNVDSGDGGSALSAGIFHPRGLVYDSVGNLYVSTENGLIRKIDSNGNISTFAGLSVENGGSIGDNVHADELALSRPYGMVIDHAKGYLYVADTGDNRVVRIDLQTKIANVVAGNGTCVSGNIGDKGPALNASLCQPTHLGLDNEGNLLVVDSGHQRIRRIHFSTPANGELAYSPVNPDNTSLVRLGDGTWERRYRDGRVAKFNSTGLHVETLSPVGLSYQYEYDGAGNLVVVRDPVGQEVTYSYSGGRLASVEDPAGRITQFQYSGLDLQRVVYPDGTHEQFVYDSSGLLVEKVDQANASTLYSYDSYNRLKEIERADGSTIKVADLASQTSGSSNSTNTPGNILDTFDGIIDATGSQTIYQRDISGYVTAIRDAEGNTTQVQRDLLGRPTHIYRPDGSQVDMSYDESTGDLVEIFDSFSGLTTVKQYNTRGQIFSESNSAGQTLMRNYDNSTGLLLSEIGSDGDKVEYAYTALGLVASKKFYLNQISSFDQAFEYDSFGKLVHVSDSGGKSKFYEFDLAGNAKKVTEVRSAGDNLVTQYSFDHFNRVTGVLTHGGRHTGYTYSPRGELIKILEPNGKEMTFQYNLIGLPIQKTLPTGATYQYAHDGNGNLVQEVDPKGNVKTYEYNRNNQLKKKILPDDTSVFSYNSRGFMVSAENNDTVRTFSVSPDGNILASAFQGRGSLSGFSPIILSHTYNAAGNRITTSDSFGGQITYGRSVGGRTTSVTNHRGESYSTEYDLLGRVQVVTGPSLQTTFGYDAHLQPNAFAYTSAAGTLHQINYSRNSLGIVTSAVTSTGTSQYSFDQDNFLATANNSFSFSNPPTVANLYTNETFQYDQNGNRFSENGEVNVIDSSGSQLVETARYRFVYDANGNVSQKISKSTGEWDQFIYNSENQLVSVRHFLSAGSMTPTQESHYWYDALGNRVQKQVYDYSNPGDPSATYVRRFVYDGREISIEMDSANNVLARFTHSGLRTDDVLSVDVTSTGVNQKVAASSGSYSFIKDGAGSVIGVVNSGGQLIQRLNYSSYGVLVGISDSAGNDISESPILETKYAFTGREYDGESGLYYSRARYYDPTVGRFMQRDPDPGVANQPLTVVNSYLYGLNNPVAYIDPNGRFPWLVIGLVALARTAHQYNKYKGNFFTKLVLNFTMGAALYYAGEFLGGTPYPDDATLAQITETAIYSSSSGIALEEVSEWAQRKGYASDGVVYGLAFILYGGYQFQNYPDYTFTQNLGFAAGKALTFGTPNVDSVLPTVHWEPNGF